MNDAERWVMAIHVWARFMESGGRNWRPPLKNWNQLLDGFFVTGQGRGQKRGREVEGA